MKSAYDEATLPTKLTDSMRDSGITDAEKQTDNVIRFALIVNILVKRQIKNVDGRREKGKQRTDYEEGSARLSKAQIMALFDKLIRATEP